MSTLNPYDKYRPLFNGASDDKRINKFLHVLKEEATTLVKSRGDAHNFVADDVQFKHKWVAESMQTRFFKRKDDHNDQDLAPELSEYLGQLALAVGGNPASQQAINIIQSLNGSYERRSEESFMIALIQQIFDEIMTPNPNPVGLAGADVNSILNPSRWGQVKSATYKSADNIVTALAKVDAAGGKFQQEALNAALTITNGVNTFVDTPAGAAAALTAGSRVDKAIHTTAVNAASAVVVTYLEGLGYQYPHTTHITDAIKSISFNSSAPTASKAQWVDALKDALAKAANNIYTTTKLFTFKMDNYLLKLLLDKHVVEASKETIDKVFPADSYADTSDNSKYFRKLDGALYTTDSNNKEIEVKVQTGSLTEAKKCFSTGVEPNTTYTCRNYFEKCLVGEKIEECKEFMQNSDFWPIAMDEIKNIDPFVALQTLKAFKFEEIRFYDNTSQTYYRKVQSYNDWVNDVLKKTNLTEAEVQSITNNTKLVGYIQGLIDKINNNLSILNEGYNIKDANLNSAAFEGTTLSKMGLKPKVTSGMSLMADLNRLEQGTRQSYNRQAISFGLPNLHGFSRSFVFTGGGHIQELEASLSNENIQTWNQLFMQYLHIKSVLKQHGKGLSNNDDTKINDLIKNLRRDEMRLKKIMLYAEKYATLISVYGENDPNTLLSPRHLKEFVEARNNRFDRVIKKQGDIFTVLKTLAEAVNKEMSEKVSEKPKSQPLKFNIK